MQAGKDVVERSLHTHKANISNADQNHESLLTSKCRMLKPTGDHGSKGKAGGYLHRSSSATGMNISAAASKSQIWVAVRENGKSISRVSAMCSLARCHPTEPKLTDNVGCCIAVLMQPPQRFSLQDPSTI